MSRNSAFHPRMRLRRHTRASLACADLQGPRGIRQAPRPRGRVGARSGPRRRQLFQDLRAEPRREIAPRHPARPQPALEHGRRTLCPSGSVRRDERRRLENTIAVPSCLATGGDCRLGSNQRVSCAEERPIVAVGGQSACFSTVQLQPFIHAAPELACNPTGPER